MTTWRLKTDAASGAVAVYSVPDPSSTDNAPLFASTAPANLARLQFFSGWIYPSTTDALTQRVPVTIPAQAANTKFSGQINLFAHGKGEPCMVEGSIRDLGGAGVHVGFNGTMPVDVHSTGHATWLALGATNTHVVLVYFGITYLARAELSLTIEASAYDFLASGPAPAGNPAAPLIRYPAVDDYVTIGRERIDTRKRYIRKAETGADFALATGPTLSIIGSGNTGAGTGPGSYVQQEIGWRWRYACAGYVKQTTVSWAGTATDGGTYQAPYILVKR